MTEESLPITLRRVSREDAELIHHWRNQPSTLRFQASPKRDLDQVREMLEEQAIVEISPNACGRFGWMILVGQEPSGHVQLTINGQYDRRHNNGHLGYMVGESFQGQGVATGGVRLAASIGFAYTGLGLERIEAVAAVDNIASRRVLEKVGFQFEGIRRKLLLVSGERVDHACYARLATDDQE